MKNFAALLTLLLAIGTANAQGMFHRFEEGSVSVGATGQFTSVLTANPQNYTYTYPVLPRDFVTVTASGQQQYTTMSAGFVTKVQITPLPFAGLEFNYGFTHYSERFNYNTVSNTSAGSSSVRVPTYWNEVSGAYMIHPKHIPFQPYLGIGGGGLDFMSSDNQWRGMGLVETGFDIPMKNKHTGFRIGARSLFYRAPNFDSQLLSTRSWRATSEPEISSYIKF